MADALRSIGALRSVYISPFAGFGTVAAWTVGVGSDIANQTCDATDEVAKFFIPIQIPILSDGGQGSSILNYVKVAYTIGTAALDAAVTGEFHTFSIPAEGAAISATVVAATVSGPSDTKTVDEHVITVTPDTSISNSGAKAITLELSFDKAATSTVAINGAWAYYTPVLA